MDKPLRIVSDGTIFGTIVYDGEGRVLRGFTEIKINIDADGDFVSAELTVGPVEIDLHIDSDKVKIGQEG